MENNTFFIFSALLIILSIINSSNKPSLASRTPLLNSTTDKNALIQFKTFITSDPHHILATNWSTDTSSSVCQWIGVSCSTKHNNRVTGFSISGFGLRGTLSPYLGNLTFLTYLDISYNNFTGPIPRELSRLRRLRSIDIGFNSFAGQIPTWFGAFPQLEIMRLTNNTFTGSIPQEWSLLQRLRLIDMENNSLTGQIPVGFGALPQLELLNLRNNKLNGKIPEEIGNCSSLQILYLSVNQLTGSIPYIIFNLSSIREIRAPHNYLSGTLPSDMCNNLRNLTLFAVGNNQLEGSIPPNIGNCTNLEVLSLAYNRFNGEIPSEIARLSMLRLLYLGTNEFTGSIPKQIGNCTALKEISLSYNHLTGTLPQELNKLAFLETFYVAVNQLSGSIPPWIFNISTLKVLDLTLNHFSGSLPLSPELSLSNLKELYLSINELNGEIPISITNASNLNILELSNNSFSGTIPNLGGSLRLLRTLLIWDNSLSGLGFLSSLANCQFLEDLEISSNPLNGILPHSIGNLSKSLTNFQARGCNISGVIPSTIGKLIGLQFLDLGENQITGAIPPTLGKLNRLQVLYLYANQLHGFIPQDTCGMSNIGELYLDENNLTGPIPKCFGELKSLRNVYLGSNKLNSSIPLNFWNLKDLLLLDLPSNRLSGQLPYKIAGLRQLYQLDLSYNQFSGDIPRSIDGCESLTYLNLSDNKFERSIPPSLGNIRALRALDLSNNSLSGLIPESLEGLKFLQYFNVSYNKLEGTIPTGGPFVNITAQSFLHNSALCGDQRFQVPPCIGNNLNNSRLKKVGRLMKYIVPPLISVIILTAIILFILVRTRKPKRGLASTDDVSLGVTWRRISYIELVRGTDAFSETNLLGNGSFGSVFKGVLSDGLNVAVKVFNSQLERVIRSFDTECEILSSIRHRNLVQIIGCCSNTEFKALILGFMPNGSLEKWLHLENCGLDLISRLQIAIDVALALEYLHHGHSFPVVHCDIKPSNVLLDEDMVAHLCDFGIAKLFDDGENIVLTKTLGTIGYAAPEYGSGGRVSTSADVYSYGILLLEMFTSKKPTDDIFNEEMSLKEWVLEAIQENTVAKIVGPNLLASEDQNFHAKEECFSSIFGLAMKCLAVMPDERINMMETTATLQRIKAKFVADTTNHQQYALSIISRQ